MQGSGTHDPPLLAAMLVDRLTLMTLPALRGTGKLGRGEGSLPPMPDFIPIPGTSVHQTPQPAGMARRGW
jgi:hypothetical protein